jgi:hypothetical protein
VLSKRRVSHSSPLIINLVDTREVERKALISVGVRGVGLGTPTDWRGLATK